MKQEPRDLRATARAGLVLVSSMIAAAAGPAAAQDVAAPEVQRVTPSSRYAASGAHRFFFGTDYRQLWTMPIAVDVLDLRTYAGGLTPVGTGGGQQTEALRFVSTDGRPFTFRSLDKDPSAVLPPDLQDTFAARLVQDQVSSAYPTAPLVVDRILDAAAVLHSKPRIVVLPDDGRLGEYRAQFAGRLGTLEQWPDAPGDAPAFAGAAEIVSTDDLFERLDTDPANRVDVRAYLTARLVDVLIGDWDRHRGQWRWARFPGEPNVWVPIPEDRDQAFARFDGLFLHLARVHAPQLVKFGKTIPGMLGMAWNGRDVDRRLLAGLEHPAWDSVTAALVARITDSAIDSAVRMLPDAHYELNGAWLAATLKQRRDALPAAAVAFFRHLAGEVDVLASTQDDSVHVIRRRDTLELSIGPRGTGAVPYYRRRFTASTTHEVRLYLMEGDDRVAVDGDGNAGVLFRVVSGTGDDRVTDGSRTGGTRAYRFACGRRRSGQPGRVGRPATVHPTRGTGGHGPAPGLGHAVVSAHHGQLRARRRCVCGKRVHLPAPWLPHVSVQAPAYVPRGLRDRSPDVSRRVRRRLSADELRCQRNISCARVRHRDSPVPRLRQRNLHHR